MYIPRIAIAALLVVSATVFAIGIAVERSQGETHQEGPIAGSNAPEGSEAREAAEAKARSQAAGEAHAENSEVLFGVNTESTSLVTTAVAVSLILALAMVAVRRTPVLLVVLIVALAATAFDVREAVHQAQEGRQTVLALASVTAALHLAVAALVLLVASPRLLRKQAFPDKGAPS